MCVDHVTVCGDHVTICVDHVTVCDHVTMCVDHVTRYMYMCGYAGDIHHHPAEWNDFTPEMEWWSHWLTHHAAKQMKLFPVHPPGPSELLPFSSGPLLSARVVIVGHLIGRCEQ